MLAQFRSFAKSPVATALWVVLLASFAVWGVRDVFQSAGAPDTVIQAGSRRVSASKFAQMFDRYLQNLAQQNNGQPVSRQDAIKQGMDQRILDEVSYQESLSALLTREGIRPSDRLVADELAKASRFFDPITGKFNPAAYKQFLVDNHLTAQEVEGELRDEIAQSHALTGLVAGLQAPHAYSALEALYNSESRTFSGLLLPPSAVPAPAKPTDAEMQAYLNQSGAKKPATRQVLLVRFSASQLAPTVTVDPAQVEKRFAFEKDTLSTPDKRTFVQIPLKSADQAAGVAAQLKAGADPAAVARKLGVQPIVYTDQPRTGVPDAKVADAAFALKAGEVSGPVQGGLGLSVLKVTAASTGHAATLDEARPKIEAEVRKYAAMEKASALVQKYEDARSGGAGLVEAARRVGLQVVPAPPFDAQGRGPNGQPLPVPPQLVETAFKLPAGGDSEVMEAGKGQGEFYAIHVDKVNAAAPFTLEEVRPILEPQLMKQALYKALKAKADEVAARLRKGEAVDAVAASTHATPMHAVKITRDSGQTYSPELLAALYQGKVGDVVEGPDPKAGVIVAHLDAVNAAPALEVARAAEGIRQNASTALLEDVAVHARDAARAIIKPRVNVQRARQAIGADASAAGASGGA